MLSIGNDRISLTVVPAYGARVVALTDRNSGRQWMVTGSQSANTGEHAVYAADEAVGWDECFPTVLACNHPAWGGYLRDHGAFWGRNWSVDRAAAGCVETRFENAQFRFLRCLTVRQETVFADYRVTNLGNTTLPYLWSQHCLLKTVPGDQVTLSGHENMRAGQDHFQWPHHAARDLGTVGPISEGFALKAYAETLGHASASVTGTNGGIRLEWDDVPAMGLWFCYGGWPVGNPVHQVALEPTTAAADDLISAEAMGQARLLGAGETHTWSVRMTLTHPGESTLQ